MKFNNKDKEEVESREYSYIGTYERYEKTIDKSLIIPYTKYVRVECPYCKKEYDVSLRDFRKGSNCRYCCNEYKNSFAYHIQRELKEPLSKYWDYDDIEKILSKELNKGEIDSYGN